ncbi:uncharacterized protein FSUBG_6363 [Fusarium subglutinans]|uniref:Glucan 1, 4-alpha-glucosidase n=1 Tax=Gibberella subglutinans TaxID=42677 RepID=A0A8H5PZ09_GIBSU|nr:uncharacterized protein FSUBG_6363 [Fusarium subglutinans]KAF5605760.1 hypothetical protein FSUBG_6363 [Fusarium subglutinans]
MEDPWGSPWTNDEPPKIDLPAPPPHAHFTADHSGSSQRVSPAHTPWNEDDDTWGGWAEAGKDSSPRWGRSPGLRPIGGSPAGSRLPSPAPVPWGHSPTFNTARLRKEDNGDSAISLGDGLRPVLGRIATRTPSPVRSLKENAADIWQQPDPALSNRSLSPLPIDDEGRPESPSGVPRPALQRGTRPPALRQPSNKVSELVEMYDDMAKSSHSASPIDPSMRKVSDNASVQDVTIGMEVDEPDATEGELQTKVGVEKELKEYSNEELEIGLEEEVEENSKLQSEPDAKVEIVSEETLDQDENVVENVIAESPKDEAQRQTDSDSWSDFESPMKEAQQDEAKQPEVEFFKEQPTAATIDTTSHEETTKEPALAPPKPPLEPFAIDMAKLDNIFPSVEASFPSPEPIPDVIIDDSFTSISERKAWYLMSRPGSMRKHNLGDDENYVRVGWGNSQVREQAIRIVRRWMEEDSITGRVVLGRRGGAAGAKIFNWDSSAPSTEISISELLARKNHSRHASAASKGTIPSPTVAAFGWGGNPIPSPTVAAPSSAPRTSTTSEPRSSVETSPVEATKTSPVSKTKATPLVSPPRPCITEEPPSPIKPIPLQPTNRPISITQPLHFPASPTISEPHSPLNPPSFLSTNRPVSVSQAPTSPLAQPPTNAGWGEDDDDDDWGDMVSSPTAETNGGFTSMDAIVDSSSNDNKDHSSQPSTTAQSPLDDIVQSAPQSEIVTNGRPSMDAPPLPPQSSAPNHAQTPTDPWNISALQGKALSHSRSTTVDLAASPMKSLAPNHSRSTTLDLGTPQSPLASLASANLISNTANTPIEQVNKVDAWDSWGLGLLDDSNKPVRSKEDGMFASQQLQAPTPVDTFKDMASPKKPRPVSLPVPPRPKTVVEPFKDDEIVANILRDLPDLSYMLR